MCDKNCKEIGCTWFFLSLTGSVAASANIPRYSKGSFSKSSALLKLLCEFVSNLITGVLKIQKHGLSVMKDMYKKAPSVYLSSILFFPHLLYFSWVISRMSNTETKSPDQNSTSTLMQMLQCDWLSYWTLSAISVQLPKVVHKMRRFYRFSEVLEGSLDVNG